MSDSVRDCYESIVMRLKAVFTAEEARAMADRVVDHYFNLSPWQRVMAGTTEADKEKVYLIEGAVNKLVDNIPLQYVLGTSFFMDLELIVNPSVLIPRPETEELVTLILKQYSGNQISQKLNILDIGTGSGCIPIALKRYIPESNVSSIDLSGEALMVAHENALRNQVVINLIKADILDQTQWKAFPQFDLIVSNPPYVTHEEKKQMKPNVLNHEPHTALFVPDNDPLIFYRCIMNFAKAKLINGGTIWVEINEAFGKEVLSLFEDNMFKERELLKDMFGKYRFVKVTK